MAAKLKTIAIPGVARATSRLCLGTATFGSAISRQDSFALLDAFASAGGTFLDTAHIYASWLPGGTGASESTIGAWLASRNMEGRMVVATKGGHPDLSFQRPAFLRPDEIACHLRDSLARLAVSTIDLYYLHRDDPGVPVEEILSVLEEHRRSGRIRAYAASNWSTARLSAAMAAAKRHGWQGFSASQIGWSLADAHPDRIPKVGLQFMDGATLSWHRITGLKVIPYSSQASGFFAKSDQPELYSTPANLERRQRVLIEARRRGVTPNALALAWLLSHPCGGSAVIGPRTLEQLNDSMHADGIEIDATTSTALAA
jgi:aryl-alcohol dehydrogenase-like predicted oxidoreductase